MTASPRRLGLVHTSATLVPAFEQLCRERLPGVAVFNIVDDSLIKDVIAHGRLRPATARRVVQHVVAAEAAGAEGERAEEAVVEFRPIPGIGQFPD